MLNKTASAAAPTVKAVSRHSHQAALAFMFTLVNFSAIYAPSAVQISNIFA
jgi:hypothetical protein